MASTGEIPFTQASTTQEDPHLDEPWVSPANALDSNDTYASVTAGTFDINDQTEILRVYDASTALATELPSDLVSIDGVIVRINAYSDSATLVDFDLVQLLDAAGALSGSNLASPSVQMGTDTAAVHVFGTSTEKWGLGAGLTRTLLIDPQFGVGIGVLAQTNNSQAFIDYVTIEVAYTPAATGHTVTPSDSLTLSDTRALGQGEGLASTLALADTRAFAVGKGLVDSLLPSDSFGRVSEYARTPTDTSEMSDALAYALGKALADSLALGDLADPVNVPGAPGETVTRTLNLVL